MKNLCTETKSRPRSLQLEKAHTATKTQHSKNKKNKIISYYQIMNVFLCAVE